MSLLTRRTDRVGVYPKKWPGLMSALAVSVVPTTMLLDNFEMEVLTFPVLSSSLLNNFSVEASEA